VKSNFKKILKRFILYGTLALRRKASAMTIVEFRSDYKEFMKQKRASRDGVGGG
jgi:hypothetical protein